MVGQTSKSLFFTKMFFMNYAPQSGEGDNDYVMEKNCELMVNLLLQKGGGGGVSYN